jgi:hypothetical protein
MLYLDCVFGFSSINTQNHGFSYSGLTWTHSVDPTPLCRVLKNWQILFQRPDMIPSGIIKGFLILENFTQDLWNVVTNAAVCDDLHFIDKFKALSVIKIDEIVDSDREKL